MYASSICASYVFSAVSCHWRTLLAPFSDLIGMGGGGIDGSGIVGGGIDWVDFAGGGILFVTATGRLMPEQCLRSSVQLIFG